MIFLLIACSGRVSDNSFDLFVQSKRDVLTFVSQRYEAHLARLQMIDFTLITTCELDLTYSYYALHEFFKIKLDGTMPCWYLYIFESFVPQRLLVRAVHVQKATSRDFL